mmetsp:Transcript_91595/g.236435  ORF Transcript_91595/g.236435 Transcript_91595/m.236435 type:complete len:234 (+) Transcript_91595:744-1445(+)
MSLSRYRTCSTPMGRKMRSAMKRRWFARFLISSGLFHPSPCSDGWPFSQSAANLSTVFSKMLPHLPSAKRMMCTSPAKSGCTGSVARLQPNFFAVSCGRAATSWHVTVRSLRTNLSQSTVLPSTAKMVKATLTRPSLACSTSSPRIDSRSRWKFSAFWSMAHMTACRAIFFPGGRGCTTSAGLRVGCTSAGFTMVEGLGAGLGFDMMALKGLSVGHSFDVVEGHVVEGIVDLM